MAFSTNIYSTKSSKLILSWNILRSDFLSSCIAEIWKSQLYFSWMCPNVQMPPQTFNHTIIIPKNQLFWKRSTFKRIRSPILKHKRKNNQQQRSPQISQRLEYKGHTKERPLTKLSLEPNHILERITKPLNLYQLKRCPPNFHSWKKKIFSHFLIQEQI